MLKTLTAVESRFSQKLLDYIETAKVGKGRSEDDHECIKIIQKTLMELSSLDNQNGIPTENDSFVARSSDSGSELANSVNLNTTEAFPISAAL